MAHAMPQQVELPDAGRGWLKRYEAGPRRLRLWLLNRVVAWLRVPSLRAAPARCGDAARQLEQRRLVELAEREVRVPQVLQSGESELLLADLGPTLAARLRGAGQPRRLQLLAQAAEAIAATHARGACLGQPLARNITVDDAGRVGFLDFEEDPLEVMTLGQAQCRDWLLFAAGSVRHAGDASIADLAGALAVGLIQARPEVRVELADALHRLRPVGRLSAMLGKRARGIHLAIEALREGLRQGS